MSHEKGQQPSQQLPRARYLIKLEKKKESCIAPIVKLLQRQGLECEVEKRHVIVTADAGKLKSQVYRPIFFFGRDPSATRKRKPAH